ncbi:hypothetical protein BGZ91_005527, partial [Linnemannia elongata]
MDQGQGSAMSIRYAAHFRVYIPFEFKMLHGCPGLETLRLHMRTEHGHHTRLILKSDLFISSADGGSQERIVAPNLRKLYMNGSWEIDDPNVVLPQFL